MRSSSRNQLRPTCVDPTIGVAASGGRKKLNVPKGFAIAPEDDEFAEEIRQMIVGRYRVLFTIRKHKVHVLHVRGAHGRGD